MTQSGPIIIVEDDPNDAEVIAAALRDAGLPNETRIMGSGQEAHHYLCTTQDKPFLILCDIRMPGMDGLALRKSILDNTFLRNKSIPFVFLTGAVSAGIVQEAYDLQVQGFFRKAKSYEGIKEQLLLMCLYWKNCLHPNNQQ